MFRCFKKKSNRLDELEKRIAQIESKKPEIIYLDEKEKEKYLQLEKYFEKLKDDTNELNGEIITLKLLNTRLESELIEMRSEINKKNNTIHNLLDENNRKLTLDNDLSNLAAILSNDQIHQTIQNILDNYKTLPPTPQFDMTISKDDYTRAIKLIFKVVNKMYQNLNDEIVEEKEMDQQINNLAFGEHKTI